MDPIAEWKQMYHEVWRIERSYFYDANLHGVNSADSEKEFEKYLDSLASRSDLNYIFHEMLGEITSGHLRGGGGNIPEAKRVPGGLLGADYEIVNGRYRFRKIYTGESWNPQMRAPLVQPGINVAAGDYLLAVNGQDLHSSDDVFRLFEGTADKRVVLRIGPDPAGANSREITVMPVASEQPLRHQAWVEENRRKVDQLSGGKLAYVYMPDTAMGGLTSFDRYYFAQVDKQGAIIDERFNSGGQAADYVIRAMSVTTTCWKARLGEVLPGVAGEVAVGGGGVDAPGAGVADRLGGRRQRARGADHVIDEQRGLVTHISDDVADLGHLLGGALLVEDGQVRADLVARLAVELHPAGVPEATDDEVLQLQV